MNGHEPDVSDRIMIYSPMVIFLSEPGFILKKSFVQASKHLFFFFGTTIFATINVSPDMTLSNGIFLYCGVRQDASGCRFSYTNRPTISLSSGVAFFMSTQ